MLPPIHVSLPIIFILWCIAAVSVHGWIMLAYPAMWAVVGLLYVVLSVLIKSRGQDTSQQVSQA